MNYKEYFSYIPNTNKCTKGKG